MHNNKSQRNNKDRKISTVQFDGDVSPVGILLHVFVILLWFNMHYTPACISTFYQNIRTIDL